jgi:hypothetical protein
MVSAPTFWFSAETGLNALKIARINEVRYLVAGYTTGMRLKVLEPEARNNKKRLGGMVELSRYGESRPVPKERVVDSFRKQIDSGASLMMLYPLANFNVQRTNAKFMAKGVGYRPVQSIAWAECVDFLRRKKLIFESPYHPQDRPEP